MFLNSGDMNSGDTIEFRGHHTYLGLRYRFGPGFFRCNTRLLPTELPSYFWPNYDCIDLGGETRLCRIVENSREDSVSKSAPTEGAGQRNISSRIVDLGGRPVSKLGLGIGEADY